MLTFTFAACLFGALNVSDGTIVVLENSNPVVQTVTHSDVTHVGLILNFGERTWVYEATPKEVRRLKWEDYCAEIAELNRRRSTDNSIRLRLYEPARAYTADEFARILRFLNTQLGRRYSVRGYVRNQPGDGIHCSEFVSTALARTGRYHFPPNYSITPDYLVTRLIPTHRPPRDLVVQTGESQNNWCQRSWNWWAGAWNWCGWACWETWTICR